MAGWADGELRISLKDKTMLFFRLRFAEKLRFLIFI
jgi:hypothetical protein